MKNFEGAYVGSSDQHESIEKNQGVRRKKGQISSWEVGQITTFQSITKKTT